MQIRTACFTLLVVAFSVHVAEGQPAKFGTCAYWHEHGPQASRGNSQPVDQGFRIGVAQGFVLGALGRIPGEPHPEASWERLEEQYLKGTVEAMQRPLVLVDGFDTKCADYKNRGVMLYDVGLLVFLEIGGASATGIEKALEVFRGGGDPTRALDALIAAK